MARRRLRIDVPVRLRVLLVGGGVRQEFGPAIAQLHAAAEVISIAGLEAAEAFLAEEADALPVVEFAVLVQSHAGQYALAALERLVRLTPLTRWVVLAGSWCEGELRSGQVSSLAERVYWHAWPAWCALNFPRDRFLAAPAPACHEAQGELAPAARSWRIRSAVFAVDAVGSTRAASGEPVPIALRAWQTVDFEGLAEVLSAWGYQCLRLDPRNSLCDLASCQAAIWVLRYGDAREAAELAEFSRRVLSLPILAIAHFPRTGDVARLHSAGATRVLAAPFLLDDLAWNLAQLAPARRSASQVTAPQ